MTSVPNDDAPVPWKTLVTAPTSAVAPRPRATTRAIVVRLAVGLAAVLVVVGLLAAWAAQWLAEREAVNDAATVTDVLADAVIQPHLTDAFADGDPASVEEFDAVVRAQVLGDDVVRVKIWEPDGTVLYADEAQLIGRTFELDEAQREALENPSTRASVSDLDEEENVFESGSRLLEVYRPVWAPDGRQLLFEVYLPYEPVATRSADLWRGFAGVTTSSLLLLIVLTAPIVWGLLRRLNAEESRRADLLQHAVDASDAERRRVAGTLHDGPVQELVATSFAAESAADASVRSGDDAAADRLRSVAAAVRGNVRVLRSLLMDIYPPGLAAAGLSHALHDLAATARSRSADVELDLPSPPPELSAGDEQLIYRVAQETLRNAVTHAVPCRVVIRLHVEGDEAILDVVDDGAGFDPSILDRPPRGGHLGTTVLRDLARQGRAELSVATSPGRGTRWRLRLPMLSARMEDPS
ncbi:sensor histidine kinase [Microbacterium sp. 1.5R]|uniref:sensor histidine kinase n=1 Tax=Microbacterium sp. 1.5R TaxID=1916917 RepID=UPI0011A789E4|nr:ATP-binding protein [Microbacterium sp. 1.5R]